MNAPEDFLHRHRVRVRYCETDRGGVSHHGSHIDWVEEARTEWLRARGKTYREFEENGVFLYVSEVQLKYVRPTTYDDELEIATRVTERGGASVTFEYEITMVEGGAVVARVTTKLACLDAEGKIRRLPADL